MERAFVVPEHGTGLKAWDVVTWGRAVPPSAPVLTRTRAPPPPYNRCPPVSYVLMPAHSDPYLHSPFGWQQGACQVVVIWCTQFPICTGWGPDVLWQRLNGTEKEETEAALVASGGLCTYAVTWGYARGVQTAVVVDSGPPTTPKTLPQHKLHTNQQAFHLNPRITCARLCVSVVLELRSVRARCVAVVLGCVLNSFLGLPRAGQDNGTAEIPSPTTSNPQP